MASGGALKELCEEASCSICLELFRDPVSLAECGHNFCRACLDRAWGEAGAGAACPQCRATAREEKLRPNQPLANMAGILQRLSPQGEGEGKEGACEKHQEPLKYFCKEDEAPLCAVCCRSQQHRDHRVIPLEEAAREKETVVVAARREGVCPKHQQPLKLFCKEDEAPLCLVCEQSPEHRYHNILPVEEAAPEYKDRFCSCLEVLQKERNEILARRANLVKESQDLLRQTKGEQLKVGTKFRQLHSFLDKQEKLLLAQMEEVEEEVARRRDLHLAELVGALSSLESLIREMEEKCQQPAADLLQGARDTLQRYEEREAFKNPVAFPLALKWRIWDLSDLSPLLEGIKKQLKEALDSGLHLQKANVSLDPDTAHPRLILSKGQKSVRQGEKRQALPDNPERFDAQPIVLGCEEFTAGRHFWEVLLGSEQEWAVGVAKKSVKRKGAILFSHDEGIWGVGKWGGSFRVFEKRGNRPLTMSGELKRIRVCLNCAGGRVAFFNADQASLLYEVSGASFSGETLLPFFEVGEEGHLKISS